MHGETIKIIRLHLLHQGTRCNPHLSLSHKEDNSDVKINKNEIICAKLFAHLTRIQNAGQYVARLFWVETCHTGTKLRSRDNIIHVYWLYTELSVYCSWTYRFSPPSCQLLDLVTFHRPNFEHFIIPPRLALLTKLINRYNKNNMYNQHYHIISVYQIYMLQNEHCF
jgi:hypothetical protein